MSELLIQPNPKKPHQLIATMNGEKLPLVESIQINSSCDNVTTVTIVFVVHSGKNGGVIIKEMTGV